jgi:hypothetical protein
LACAFLTLALFAGLCGTASDLAQGVEVGFGTGGGGIAPIITGPSFTTQPGHQTVAAGLSAAFTVATNYDRTAFQWQISNNNGTAWSNLTDNSTVSGSNTTTLTLGNTTLSMTGLEFRAQDLVDQITSSNATLTILPIVVTILPGNQTAPAGSNVTFTAQTLSSSNVTFQWLKNNARISRATQSNLTLTNVQSINDGKYSFIATNQFGRATSNLATLTVTKAAPVIVAPPISGSASINNKFQFTVVAQGTQPFHYAWKRNGSALRNGSGLTGVNSISLNISRVIANDYGTYQVTVTNSAGSVTSTGANLSSGGGGGAGDGTGPTLPF